MICDWYLFQIRFACDFRYSDAYVGGDEVTEYIYSFEIFGRGSEREITLMY